MCFTFNLWAAYKDKGCFVPRWSNSSEAKGQSCQVTGLGIFSVSAASCPGKADSQVGHLSGMDYVRAHQWGHPESNGPEQFHCQLYSGHTNSLHLSLEIVSLWSESLSMSTTYFECWALKPHLLSLESPSLELWMNHSLIIVLKLEMESLTPQNFPQVHLQGLRDLGLIFTWRCLEWGTLMNKELAYV